MKNDLEQELRELYINQNKSTTELAEHYKVAGKTLRSWLKKFNIEKPKELTNLHRQEARKKSNLAKYGVEHTSQLKENREKMKSTCIEKFGVDNAAKSEIIKEQVKQNNLQKYGETNPLKVFEIREKIRLNNLAQKGYSFPYQVNKNPAVLNILSSKSNLEDYLKTFNSKPTIYELCNKLNYTHSAMLHIIKKYDLLELISYRPSVSQYEKELIQMFNNCFQRDRTILNPLEIDLYNDSHKLGIEFNGNYWHSLENKGKNYHQNKSLIALSKSIHLIHIFEYEWDNEITRNKIINAIQNVIDDQRIQIYARECQVKEITSIEAGPFLDQYHLQNRDKASVRLGLFYNNELVGVMTFCKPRFNKNYEWELSRLCFSNKYKILAGSEKLLKYFERVYKPSSLITYCDISKFTGEVYKRLGFELQGVSKPNYVWCNNKGEIFTRYECQKHKLIKRFPEYVDLTETEIMTSLGYWKIEDSGNQIWTKKIPC